MAVTIKETSKEFTAIEKYLMTISPEIEVIKNLPDGTVLNVDGYLLFDDIKDTGESSEIMSIITTDKKVFSTQSATFKRAVKDIFSVMGKYPFPVKKISATTKAGRPYVNAVLAYEEL